jgi:hypothetical protein
MRYQTLGKRGYAGHRAISDSSRGLWRSFHVQSPSRLGKARLYLASRQPVELPIRASTHLLSKSSQIQGFHHAHEGRIA